MGKTILYVGDFKFSKMNAECQLVLGNGYALRKLGYNVVYIGNDIQRRNYTNLSSTHKQYEKFDVYNVPFDRGLSDVYFARSIQKEIENIANNYDIKMLICYGTPTFSLALYYLYFWCKKYHFPFVVNCVDIPDLSQGGMVQKIIRVIDRKLRYILYKKADGMIAVSSYIESYFKTSKIRPTIIVPPIRDVEKFEYKRNHGKGNQLKFVYGGCPFPTDGRQVPIHSFKDRLDIAIDYVSTLLEEGYNITFDIFGITIDEYKKVVNWQGDLLDKHQNEIIFHGMVSNHECMQGFIDSDFSILLRKDVEMTKAGFSTKVVDSITCGIPVLTTKVGDLSKYEDKDFVIFIDIDDKNKSVESMKKIAQIDRKSIEMIKNECYQSKLFDFNNYCCSFENFISKL